jgi:hypothetical protein
MKYSDPLIYSFCIQDLPIDLTLIKYVGWEILATIF